MTTLRELSEAEFAARYGCDRFTATVLGNRFDYLVEHMSVRLLTGAFSPVLRDVYDLAATLSGPPSLGYAVPAVGNGIVLMAGTTIDAVRNTVEESRRRPARPR
ncbi:N-methylhydantoinase B/oxoprolinase/acetone carboxylase alpha subunit [Thermocatellispora tengchongensis]|uniref:N-methylhydantoinase B/oxoprolinase/acetone carboxylase alpha subunit n=1 Tax=Thermocatellispora tengchongensis TaxID=1073253 RepID=A0A840PCQ9_9ACTN|nr:hydantoinase B/oxoprolinase family protein [Thermocatellispora tengchongensis]MBB5136769.1 N-methylhydantoinase B/oxoprolinase/acetone carboxylase alpha subunit [Thermocatellispora tengchongensis]